MIAISIYYHYHIKITQNKFNGMTNILYLWRPEEMKHEGDFGRCNHLSHAAGNGLIKNFLGTLGRANRTNQTLEGQMK